MDIEIRVSTESALIKVKRYLLPVASCKLGVFFSPLFIIFNLHKGKKV